MAAKASIIKIYINVDSDKKVDIIYKHYPNFIGIVDCYIEGLRYNRMKKIITKRPQLVT